MLSENSAGNPRGKRRAFSGVSVTEALNLKSRLRSLYNALAFGLLCRGNPGLRFYDGV
jgi:hypothetical protein